MIDKLLRCGWLLRRSSPLLRSARATAFVPIAQKPHYSSGTPPSISVQEGQQVCGFRVTNITEVPELSLTTVRLQHVATGADYLHVAKDDSNNLFSIAFRTTPLDSSGVPHILEHTVLCGSRLYPVHDPFFKMLSRSLSTFMNAFTSNDFTMYPFTTQNPTDFENLMSVYLDAVFYPKLTEDDFYQEGWRFEHSNPEDRNSPIEFKGVVFNEMKGVFADAQNLFMQKLQNGLLPSHTYGVVSGGYPLDIPSLTVEKLRHFHKVHYHPSNSRIMTYGNFPLERHLDFINSKFLKDFSKIEVNTQVPDEELWSKPRSDRISCMVDTLAPLNEQCSVAISYRLANVTDVFECFVLSILSELLTDGPNAPFYKSLLEPQLGRSFSPVTGYSVFTRNTTFTIGLQGAKEDNVDEVLNAINKTFESVVEDGIPRERIDACLHKIELQLKHQTVKFGLGLAFNLASQWNQDGDPIEQFRVNEHVSRFRQCLKENPKFLQDKVKHYFVDNKHKYTLTMLPKDGFEDDLKRKENLLLRERLDLLSKETRSKVFEVGQNLLKQKNIAENLDCLPTLHVSDIARKISPTPLTQLQLGGVNVTVCPQATNGVAYFKAVLDTQHVTPSLVPYVPLLAEVLTEMGAGGLNFREFDHQVQLTSGGLGAEPVVNQNVQDYNIEKGVLLSSHCLIRNLNRCLDLWGKILNEVNLKDVGRFTTLVSMAAVEKSNSLIQNGHSYAKSIAQSTVSQYGSTTEMWSGFAYLNLLKELSEVANLEETLGKVYQLASEILNKEHMRVCIHVEPDHVDSSLKDLECFLNSVTGTPAPYETHPKSRDDEFTPHSTKRHCVFPFPVNYVACAVPGVPYRHPDSGNLRVLAHLLFPFLLREIREKGGAYGGGATALPGGPFTFYSYRDPNAKKTLATFEQAIEWVLRGEFSERELEEAKLGVFQSIDAPVSPGCRGDRLFLGHVTDSVFEQHRESVLDAEPQDVINAARIHVHDCLVQGSCLIGPANDELSQDPFWKIL